MAFAFFIVYGWVCYFTYSTVRNPRRNRPGCLLLGTWICVPSYLALLAWPWFGDEHSLLIGGIRGVWSGIVMLYGLLLALLPSGLLRFAGGSRSVASFAVLVTILAPFLSMYAFHLLGTPRADHSEGIGSVWELLFLDPIELAEGTKHNGFVTHRFRVHFLVIGALVLASSLLHLIPIRKRNESDVS